jgi:hypothetical protein
MLNLVLRLAGPLILLGTVIGVAVSAVVVATSLIRHNLAGARRALVALTAVLGVYALALAISILAAPEQRVPPGTELSFCGLDCHLHVAALAVQDGTVRFRMRSDARQAPEYPGRLRIRATDDRGRSVGPISPVGSAPLAAGDTMEAVLRFPLGAEGHLTGVTVTWGDWLDYLVPGPQNAMAQSRTTLALD